MRGTKGKMNKVERVIKVAIVCMTMMELMIAAVFGFFVVSGRFAAIQAVLIVLIMICPFEVIQKLVAFFLLWKHRKNN